MRSVFWEMDQSEVSLWLKQEETFVVELKKIYFIQRSLFLTVYATNNHKISSQLSNDHHIP